MLLIIYNLINFLLFISIKKLKDLNGINQMKVIKSTSKQVSKLYYFQHKITYINNI